MTICENSRGKRRHSGHSENKTAKKARLSIQAGASSSSSEIECKSNAKRRARKRTKALRELIKNKIEIALSSSSSPLSRLFTSRDDNGTPQAPYKEVVRAIGLEEKDWLKAVSLSARAIESISNITDSFCIERSQQKALMVKYRVPSWTLEDCTVYLDNLPEGCTSERISRIARKFGTVVEVRLPKSSSRPVPSPFGVLELGKRPKSFAFVQFTKPEACQEMCTAFSRNVPVEGLKRVAQPLVPLLQRLLVQIRKLSRRRRRRTFAQNLLLIKLKRQQAAIIRKERTAFRRTHKLSKVAEREKAAKNSEHENGRLCSDNSNLNGEHNTCTLEGCNNRRGVKAKKSEKCLERLSSQIKNDAKARRKHRKRRSHEIGPHTITGSVDEYFEKLQVLPFARYRQLRAEYVSLRRESDRQFRNHVREQLQLMQPTKLSRQELNSKLASCRDVFWCTNPANQEPQ